MKNKKVRVIALVLAVLLSGLTHVLPMFLAVPKYIYLNIAGTLVVALSFGPLSGAVYAGLVHLVLNNIGMGMGIQPAVALSQMIQALLLGLLLRKRGKGSRLVLPALIMSLSGLAINSLVYGIFNNSLGERLRELPGAYIYFLQNNFLDSLFTYLLSIGLALGLVKILHIKEI